MQLGPPKFAEFVSVRVHLLAIYRSSWLKIFVPFVPFCGNGLPCFVFLAFSSALYRPAFKMPHIGGLGSAVIWTAQTCLRFGMTRLVASRKAATRRRTPNLSRFESKSVLFRMAEFGAAKLRSAGRRPRQAGRLCHPVAFSALFRDKPWLKPSRLCVYAITRTRTRMRRIICFAPVCASARGNKSPGKPPAR
jgi:hypothetical protein